MTVDDLLRAAREGDEEALEELSRHLFEVLHGFFAHRHQDADARDLTQRTLMVVLAKLDKFEIREHQPLLNWVFGIARREAQCARKQRGRDARLAQRFTAMRASPSPPTGPVTHVERIQRRELVEWVLQQLDTTDREVIEHDLARGTAETLAKLRGITINHAYVLRSRARKKFHRLLEQAERAAEWPLPSPSPPR